MNNKDKQALIAKYGENYDKDIIMYRDFEISLSCNPYESKYEFCHIGYDGAPDSYDGRFGFGDTIEECKQAIDDMILDLDIKEENGK